MNPSPPPRRRRFPFSPQFGLRTLLLLMVVVAIGAWWYIQPPRGAISLWQAGQIKPNMTKAEVRRLLGEPLAIERSGSVPVAAAWYYRVASQGAGSGVGTTPPELRLIIYFSPGKDSVRKTRIVDALLWSPAL